MNTLTEAISNIEEVWRTRKIRLYNVGISKSDFELLHAALVKHESIKSVEIGFCDPGEEELIKFAGRMKEYSLVGLQFCRCEINDRVAQSFATAVQECTLKKLDLAYNRMTHRGAMYLALALKDSSIDELLIAGNRIGRHGAEAIAKVLAEGGTGLKTLDVADNRIGDDGAIAILRALPATGIEKLVLEKNQLTDAVLPTMCSRLVETPSIKHLEIGRNEITDLAQLFDILPNTGITEISIAKNDSIRDEAVFALAKALKAMPQMESIYLHMCPFITDKGAEALLEAAKCHPSLRKIAINNTRVHKPMERELEAYIDRLRSERAKTMVALMSSYMIPRIGCKSTFGLPRDLTRRLAMLL